MANRERLRLFFITFATKVWEKNGFLCLSTFLTSCSERRYLEAIIGKRKGLGNRMDLLGRDRYSWFVWRNTSKLLASSEAFRKSWKSDNTSISSRYDMVPALSSNVFHSIWVAYRENVSSLTATRSENLLSIYRRYALEKAMNAKSLSFLEFSYHK